MNATLNDCKAGDASHSTLIRLGNYIGCEIIPMAGKLTTRTLYHFTRIIWHDFNQ